MSSFRVRALLVGGSAIAIAACASAQNQTVLADAESMSVKGTQGTVLTAELLETFDGAWAMAFLPDGRALVTEQDGDLWLLDKTGAKAGKISNVPAVTPRGQGGLGDIIVHPDFASNGIVFISYVERDAENDELSGAAVERAKLTLTEDGGSLSERDIIWRQSPKVKGNGHYGHRLVIAPDGHLFITSGERQKFTPAQNMAMNLGKIIRINQDGSVPEDNPFYGNGAAADQVWSLGHRNPLGIAFDGDDQLWAVEMGPKGGDELNLIVRSENYGYPHVSEGDHYSGKPIATHASTPIYENPAIAWNPVISPAGLIFYDGEMFADWKGNAFIGGLSSKALIRVSFETEKTDNLGQPPKPSQTEPVASEAERYEWGERIREVEQGPDGALYVLEDENGGRLVRLTPGA
ncbi:MAG: PQQ-dependent sugar dehydrogenase [Alphaproteobacteria bacterium]|nr:PQQ-dependent sugar dehydrogenase [Alphaproteobacteria bacterium]|tara:strand:+ start:4559 stop:5776 length:1218 start_codon:yes stop_codon:yes gene_type:complete